MNERKTDKGMHQSKSSNTDILAASLIGLVQGIVVYLITEYLEIEGDLPPKYIALLAFFIVAPSTYILTATRQSVRSPAFVSIGLAALISGLYLILSGLFGDPETDKGLTVGISIFSGILISYVVIGFYRAHHETGRWADYPALFEQAWNLPIIIAIAYIFFGIGMGVLFLWGALFKLIEISFFADLFQEKWFAIPVYFTLLALGVSVVRQWERVIHTLGGVGVALLRFVSPVLFAFSALFLAALAVTGLEPLWEATSATVTTTTLVLLSALVITAVAASGDADEKPAHGVFLWAARAQSLLLPAFAGIAIYSLWLRVGQYGWNVDRLLAALFVVFALILALSYALSSVTPGWTRQLRKANTALAVIAVVMAVLIQTPLLNPFSISVSSQIARLESGKVSAAEFDYGYLKFKLGRSGQEALEELKAKTGIANHATVLEKLTEVEKQDYYHRPSLSDETRRYSLAELHDAYGDKFVIRPEGTPLNEDFEFALLNQFGNLQACMAYTGDTPCLIIAVDLFGDEGDEYLVVQSPLNKYSLVGELFYLNEETGKWQAIWHNLTSGTAQTSEDLWATLERGDFTTRELKVRALEIDGRTFTILPSDPSTISPMPLKSLPVEPEPPTAEDSQ